MVPTCPAIQPTAWHLSIGMFIGILGFLGVVVPLTKNKIGSREKAVWTGIFALLLWAELRSIRLDQIQHDREQTLARCEQLRNFTEIANTLSSSINESQAQFAATMKSVDKVFSESEQAAAFSKDGVLSMTGSDSYIVIVPQITGVSQPNNDADIYLMVTVNGKHTVWDASVDMSEEPLTVENVQTRKHESYSLGAVTGTFMSPLTLAPLHPDKTKPNEYYFNIKSRGPFVLQTLALRYNAMLSKWQYRSQVLRSYPPPLMRPRPMQIVVESNQWLEVPKVKFVEEPSMSTTNELNP